MKKPTVDQLREYAQRIGFNTFDPQAFLDHYDANGWRVGRVPMKDWRATIRTWKRHEPQYSRRPQQTQSALPYRHRENRINYLNRRKAWLMRQPQTPSVQRELERIQTELHKL